MPHRVTHVATVGVKGLMPQLPTNVNQTVCLELDLESTRISERYLSVVR